MGFEIENERLIHMLSPFAAILLAASSLMDAFQPISTEHPPRLRLNHRIHIYVVFAQTPHDDDNSRARLWSRPGLGA